MKRILQCILLGCLIHFVTGCTSSYWVDRGRDASDIFTATVGYGGGVRARIGPVHVGAIIDADKAGVKGGECALFNTETDYRSKANQSGELELPLPIIIGHPACCLIEVYEPDGVPAVRGKCYNVESAIPFVSTDFKPEPYQKDLLFNPYFTQIEVCVGIGGSIKFGFNPGEMVDFILGWTTIDIFNDDIESSGKRYE